MVKWKMPERMQLFSLWVIWAFLAIGALGWAVQVVIAATGMNDAAAWVQAFGSIIAIFAAGLFPIWHQRLQQRAGLALTDELLETAATFQFNDLEMLINCLLGNVEPSLELRKEIWDFKFGKGRVAQWSPSEGLTAAAGISAELYSNNGHSTKWDGHAALLNNIASGHMRSRMHIVHLNHLMSGAAVAQEVCNKIEGWNLAQPGNPALIKRLLYCQQNARLAQQYLDQGVTSKRSNRSVE